MNHWFPSGWLLAQVFAHEMAHQAQVDLLDDENGPIHGKSFFTWEKEFAMIGITLKKRYD